MAKCKTAWNDVNLGFSTTSRNTTEFRNILNLTYHPKFRFRIEVYNLGV